MRFRLITCFPDGSTLHDGVHDAPASPFEQLIAPMITLDGRRADGQLTTPIGPLRVEFTGEGALGVGALTVWREEQLAFTAVYMAQKTPKGLAMARRFTQGWDSAPAVRQLTGHQPVFTPRLEATAVRFGLAINFAAVTPEELSAFGDPDLDFGAAFFRALAAAPPEAYRPPGGRFGKLFGKS